MACSLVVSSLHIMWNIASFLLLPTPFRISYFLSVPRSQVQDWLSVLGRAEAAGPSQEAQRQRALRAATALRSRLAAAKERCDAEALDLQARAWAVAAANHGIQSLRSNVSALLS
jgi:hypothetical protein